MFINKDLNLNSSSLYVNSLKIEVVNRMMTIQEMSFLQDNDLRKNSEICSGGILGINTFVSSHFRGNVGVGFLTTLGRVNRGDPRGLASFGCI